MNLAQSAKRSCSLLLVSMACASILGCGGGSGSEVPTVSAHRTAAVAGNTSTSGGSVSSSTSPGTRLPDAAAPEPAAGAVPPQRVDSTEAFRFLSQASFGASPVSIDEVRSRTYKRWIADQAAVPWRALAPQVEQRYLARLASDPTARPDRNDAVGAFWREALTSQAQLRWRVAYALSQIFVLSLDGPVGFTDPLGAADYFDTLARNALGSYRKLLQAVAKHPAMGRYLSHLANQPANENTGRVPDENFAREVMQLFSIGLYQLNIDGSQKLDGASQPIPTYDADDVAGLARVFTGWSWDCTSGHTPECFNGGFSRLDDLKVGTRPMFGYADYHSKEEKRFLGVTIPEQRVAKPDASLRIALDTLANHPNVGPFIGRQLIQRLVTSNPSPAYVAAVAAVFNDNGHGRRGDLKAVVETILTHPEARTESVADGKVREPVLRLTALGRAFPLRSLSGRFDMPLREAPDKALGQTPLSAPSVFNFYRPNYVPGGGQIDSAGLVAPELQIADETSVAAYVHFMREAIEGGFGRFDPVLRQRDMQFDFQEELDLASDPPALLDRIFTRLFGKQDVEPLRSEVLAVLESIELPALNKKGSNQGVINSAKLRRMRMALLLTVASPQFIVQK